MPRKLELTNIDDLADRYRAGESAASIARSVGTTAPSIVRYLSRAGVVIRTKAEAARQTRIVVPHDVIAAYSAGQSIKHLAERYGLDRSVIRRALVDAGVSIRTRQESQQLVADNMSLETRQRMVGPAHAAVRGKSQSEEHRRRIATTREIQDIGGSPLEMEVEKLLNERGLVCVHQKAIGRYNVDLAIHECPVAVDIFGGQWHGSGRHAERFQRRVEYILDEGWYLIIMWVCSAYPLTASGADHVASVVERCRSDESIGCEYEMIGGNGKPVAIAQRKFYGRPPIVASEMPRDALGRYSSTRE